MNLGSPLNNGNNIGNNIFDSINMDEFMLVM